MSISNLIVLFFSGILGFLLFLLLFWIIYKNRKDLWQRMTTPGFGIGFMILSGWFLIVVACVSAVMSGNSYDPLAGIVNILLMPLFYYGGLAIGLVVIPMFSKRVRLARPIFVLLISFGLLSRFLNYAVSANDLPPIADTNSDLSGTQNMDSTSTDNPIITTAPTANATTTGLGIDDNATAGIDTNGSNLSDSIVKQSSSINDVNLVDTSGHMIMHFDANSGIAYDGDGREIAYIENDSLIDKNGQVIASYDRNTGLFYDHHSQPIDVKNDGGTFQHIKNAHGEGVDIVNNEVFDSKTHQRVGNIEPSKK